MVEVGDEVCIQGYVMDKFCIERGTMLDNPSLNTLEYPEKHSVHCLIDVPQCINSGFEVLSLEKNSDGIHQRLYTLDEGGNSLVATHAKSIGICSECKSELENPLKAGYQATIKGKITELGTDAPATIEVTSVEDALVGCPLKVGDELCIQGYVMDKFCIERGTLFDNPSLNTLEYPDKHSVHCLIDVPQCINSGFEVLSLEKNSDGIHQRLYSLNEEGNSLAVTHAKSIGVCTECESILDNPLEAGYQAMITGKLADLGVDGAPATIEVTSIGAIDLSLSCSSQQAPLPGFASSGLSFTQIARIHGSLMISGWGLLLPFGVICARFLKYRPNAIWFKVHRVVQPTGLIIATIGWIIALKNFDVLGFTTSGNSFNHAVCGMITMCLGLTQPLNAFFRPHGPVEGGTKSLIRCTWEVMHKSIGYFTVLLAAVTIVLGTTALPNPSDTRKFRGVYFGGVVVFLFLTVCYTTWESKKHTINKEDTSNKEKPDGLNEGSV